MWIRNFRRFIAEALSGMVKNGLMTIASIIVVTSCLFIFGVFMAVTLNVNHISEKIANSCQIQVFVTNEAKYGGQIQEISNTIKKIPHVKKVSFETGEQTFKDFKKGLSEEERKEIRRGASWFNPKYLNYTEKQFQAEMKRIGKLLKKAKAA